MHFTTLCGGLWQTAFIARFTIVCGFLNVPQLFFLSVVRRDLRAYSPYPRRLESLTICWCNYKGSTFYSVILRPWVLVQPESNSRPQPFNQLSHRCAVHIPCIVVETSFTFRTNRPTESFILSIKLHFDWFDQAHWSCHCYKIVRYLSKLGLIKRALAFGCIHLT